MGWLHFEADDAKLNELSAEGIRQASRFASVVFNTPIKRFVVPLPDGKTPYLERFILEAKPDGCKTYLHVIYESDGDRDPHDHPWGFSSQIVFGSYKEHRYKLKCMNIMCSKTAEVKQATPLDGVLIPSTCLECGKVAQAVDAGMKVFKEGDFNVKAADELHRLEVLRGPVVTLVKRGPKQREWGFQTTEGWEHHASYIQRKFPGAQPTEVD